MLALLDGEGVDAGPQGMHWIWLIASTWISLYVSSGNGCLKPEA